MYSRRLRSRSRSLFWRHSERRRRFVQLGLEQLEPRIVLDGEFWLASLAVAGEVAAPFDKLQVTFSAPVAPGAFDVADVQLSGPGGDLQPQTVTALPDGS